MKVHYFTCSYTPGQFWSIFLFRLLYLVYVTFLPFLRPVYLGFAVKLLRNKDGDVDDDDGDNEDDEDDDDDNELRFLPVHALQYILWAIVVHLIVYEML